MAGKSCWSGYEKRGTKTKGGKTVNNCVKKGTPKKKRSNSRPFIPHPGRMTATHGTGGSSLENYIDSSSSSARSEATSSSSA